MGSTSYQSQVIYKYLTQKQINGLKNIEIKPIYNNGELQKELFLLTAEREYGTSKITYEMKLYDANKYEHPEKNAQDDIVFGSITKYGYFSQPVTLKIIKKDNDSFEEKYSKDNPIETNAGDYYGYIKHSEIEFSGNGLTQENVIAAQKDLRIFPKNEWQNCQLWLDSLPKQ